MVHAISRGLMLSDFHELSVGMILDYIFCYDQLHDAKENKDENIRKAGQQDFSSF